MTPYADTNFLTRHYLELPESAEVLSLASEAERRGAAPLPISWLHRVELCNALQFHVFQGRIQGHTRVTPEQAAAALAIFHEELRARRLLRPVTLSVSDLEEQFEELSLRYTAKHGFRTYDILHVGFALLLGCDSFWSFDPKAEKLAKLEGLETRSA